MCTTATASLTSKAWADVYDGDGNDYYATMAPPQPVCTAAAEVPVEVKES